MNKQEWNSAMRLATELFRLIKRHSGETVAVEVMDDVRGWLVDEKAYCADG